jgi:hypothetical protein
MINQPGRIVAMKSRAVAYQDRISGGAVARYLTDVLKFISGDFQGMRPMAPWISSTCVGQ